MVSTKTTSPVSKPECTSIAGLSRERPLQLRTIGVFGDAFSR